MIDPHCHHRDAVPYFRILDIRVPVAWLYLTANNARGAAE